MNLQRFFYRLKLVNPNAEFALILSWALFFPDKLSMLYFFTFALLTALVLLRDIAVMKTVGISPFTRGLTLVNSLLIVSLFFSHYYFRSLLMVAEILLISCYFLLLYHNRRRENLSFRLILSIVSVFSLFCVIRGLGVITFIRQDIFFVSTIHEGIIAGIGVLIVVYELLKKWNPWFLVLIAINIAGVYVSRSKAAFIGTAIFTLLLLLLKRKKWIPVFLGIVLLTFLIPNPIRSMFYHSITRDPFALDRFNIWKMSLAIFSDHWTTGVGLDNFSQASVTYNFKQSKGPVNYYKRPRSAHNDYLKLLAETGIIGVIILSGLFYFLVRRFFSSSFQWFNLSVVLLLYLMFQAFLFNILFNPFFFFLLLFLLKNVLEDPEKLAFRSFSGLDKMLITGFVLLVVIAGYFLPWLSDRYSQKFQRATHPIEAFKYLEKARYLTPQNHALYYAGAVYLTNHFHRTGNADAFNSAINDLKTARRLNRYFIDAYLLEAKLYMELLGKGFKYTGLKDEMITVLRQAEQYNPVSPFIKLEIAKVYYEFDQPQRAKQEALKALELEPEFVAALYFLQEKFHFFLDESQFHLRIKAIREKARYWEAAPTDYLYRVFEIPPEYRQIFENHTQQ